MNKKIFFLALCMVVVLSGCQFRQASQPNYNTTTPPRGGFQVLPPRTPEPGAPTSTVPGGEPATPAEAKCGQENCHGLEISCGPNVPEMCTMEYRLGDFCRAYAICETIGGECKMVPNEKFEACKTCVADCENLGGEPAFECEAECRVAMND